MVHDAGFASAILVGDRELIEPMAQKLGFPASTEIIHEPEPAKAALQAVSLVRSGRAQVLMKGLINSADFLKAVLNPGVGLRTERILSHLVAFEIEGQEKLVFHTDSGINIAPSLQDKKEIVINAMLALRAMGITEPRVAILAANEVVNPKMPATVDARALMEMSLAGELPPGIVEGPIAMDVALNPEAARHKGIKSRVSGEVDIFVHPNIESGNIAGKTLLYYTRTRMAGVILGAAAPVVMTSRAETADGKFNSIALACIQAGKVN